MLRILLLAVAWLLLLPLTVLLYLLSLIRRPRIALLVDLEGQHPHRSTPVNPLRRQQHGIPRGTLRDRLRRAAEDPRVEVVRARIAHLSGGWAELYELRRALADVRAAGKRVVAFVPFPDTRALWVASAADEVVLSPDIPVHAAGVSAQVQFLGALLGNAGIDFEVVTAGAFKSALEGMSRSGPSDPSREALESLLDDLYGGLTDDVAAGRGATAEAIRAAFDSGPHLPEAAVEAGLADALVAEDDLADHLGYGDDGDLRAVHVESYRGRVRPWPRLRFRRPRLAMVEVRGAIRDGRHDDPNPSGATTRAVCEALDAARRSKRVKGVLLHVDSRGGSATASERMWRAVRRLAEEKPVVAWMGDAAASGGYYVACGAHTIVAAPGTLTGSIGVLSAKPVLRRLFERVGIDVLHLERGPQSSMYSTAKGFSPDEREAMAATISHFYALFLRRVAESRERTTESVHEVAQGRVWSGAQAAERGLVDQVGDEGDALRLLAERAGVKGVPRLRLIGPKRNLRRMLPFGVAAPWLDLWSLSRESTALAWCPVELS